MGRLKSSVANILLRHRRPIAVGGTLILLLTSYAILHVWLGWSWRQVSVVATLVAAITGLLIVLLTQATVREMEAGRIAQTRPVILAYFDRQQDDIVVRVANYGGGPASRIRFCFTPDLINAEGEDIGASPLLGEVIPLIPPSRSDQTPTIRFDNYDRYMDILLHWGVRRTEFGVQIHYEDPLTGATYAEDSLMDLAHLAPKRRLEPYVDPEQLKQLLDSSHMEIVRHALIERGIQVDDAPITIKDYLDGFDRIGWTRSFKKEGDDYVATASHPSNHWLRHRAEAVERTPEQALAKAFLQAHIYESQVEHYADVLDRLD